MDVLLKHSSSAPSSDDPRGFQAALDIALRAWLTAGSSGPSEESWLAFYARVSSALDDLVSGLGKGENALVFTSGGVIGALAARCLGVPEDGFVGLNRVTCNGGVTKMVTGRSGTTLVSFNEHAHLEGDGAAPLTYR